MKGACSHSSRGSGRRSKARVNDVGATGLLAIHRAGSTVETVVLRAEGNNSTSASSFVRSLLVVIWKRQNEQENKMASPANERTHPQRSA
jgi:hypothetical protein